MLGSAALRPTAGAGVGLGRRDVLMLVVGGAVGAAVSTCVMMRIGHRGAPCALGQPPSPAAGSRAAHSAAGPWASLRRARPALSASVAAVPFSTSVKTTGGGKGKVVTGTPSTAMSGIIKSVCAHYSIGYRSHSRGYILELTHTHTHTRNNHPDPGPDVAAASTTLHMYGCRLPLNNEVASELARDKAATSTLLAIHGVPHVPATLIITGTNAPTWPDLMSALEAHSPSGGLVLKPNTGLGGHGVCRVRSPAQLERAWLSLVQKESKNQTASFVWSPYVNMVAEHRVFVLDGRIAYAYRKDRPYVIGDGTSTVEDLAGSSPIDRDVCSPHAVPSAGERVVVNWLHNIGQGSRASLVDLSSSVGEELRGVATAAAAALGLRFCCVDVAEVHTGDEVEHVVLEVNTAVGVRGFLQQHPDEYSAVRDVFVRAVAKAFGIPYMPMPVC